MAEKRPFPDHMYRWDGFVIRDLYAELERLKRQIEQTHRDLRKGKVGKRGKTAKSGK